MPDFEQKDFEETTHFIYEFGAGELEDGIIDSFLDRHNPEGEGVFIRYKDDFDQWHQSSMWDSIDDAFDDFDAVMDGYGGGSPAAVQVVFVGLA